MASGYRYLVTSKWCGWFGGWGSENDIGRHVETTATGGYRLIRDREPSTFLVLVYA